LDSGAGRRAGMVRRDDRVSADLPEGRPLPRSLPSQVRALHAADREGRRQGRTEIDGGAPDHRRFRYQRTDVQEFEVAAAGEVSHKRERRLEQSCTSEFMRGTTAFSGMITGSSSLFARTGRFLLALLVLSCISRPSARAGDDAKQRKNGVESGFNVESAGKFDSEQSLVERREQ